MGILASLAVKIGADFTDFDKELKKKMATTTSGTGTKVKAGKGDTGIAAMAGAKAGAIAGVAFSTVSAFFNKGVKAFKSIIDQSRTMGIVKDILQNTIGSFLSTIFFVLYSGIQSMTPLLQPIGNIVTDLSANFGTEFTNLKEKFKDKMDGLGSALSLSFATNSGVVSDAIGLVASGIGTFATETLSFGVDVIRYMSTLESGIGGHLTKISDWLDTWWDTKNKVFMESLFANLTSKMDDDVRGEGGIVDSILSVVSVVTGVATILLNIDTAINNRLDRIGDSIGLNIGESNNTLSRIDEAVWKVAKNTTSTEERERQKGQMEKLLEASRTGQIDSGLWERTLAARQAGFSEEDVIESMWDAYMKAFEEWKTAQLKKRTASTGYGSGDAGMTNDYWGDVFSDALTGSYV